MKGTQYLITGATGNLGSTVARQLAAEGKDVRALVDKSDSASDRLPKNAEIIVGDITDIRSLEHFFSPDGHSRIVVIHCESSDTVSPDYSKKVYAINVTGTRNVVDKCVERKVGKLIYMSSTSAIPEFPRRRTIEEVSFFDPAAIVGFYGKTKAEASQLVIDAVHEQGLDASIVFPSAICGPGDYAYGPLSRFIVDYVSERISVGIAGSLNAVDVRDLAAGVVACCDKGGKGQGYIMANDCVSVRKMFRLLSSLSGARKVKVIVPAPLAKAAALAYRVASRLLGWAPGGLTSYAVYLIARNNKFSSRKAERELGYKVRPFAQTIEDSIDWLEREGKI